MAQMDTDKDEKYPHHELTHLLIGLIFQTYNEIGYGHREKLYQRAFAYKLEEAKIPFKREQYIVVRIAGKPIGRYYVDFVVDGKVVVELKIANEIYDSHAQQILEYMKMQHVTVGLLFVITKQGVKIKRFVK